MVHPVSHSASVPQARSHLHRADPVIARLIDAGPGFDPYAWISQLPPMDLYGALLLQIVGQQLSVAATRRTLERIQALFAGQLPSPANSYRQGLDVVLVNPPRAWPRKWPLAYSDSASIAGWTKTTGRACSNSCRATCAS